MLKKFSSLAPKDIAAWMLAAASYAICASAGTALHLWSGIPFIPQKRLAKGT